MSRSALRSGAPFHLVLVGIGLACAGVGAEPANAQRDAIRPAETIRVVEVADRWGSGVERRVVESLTPAEVLTLQVALVDAGYEPGPFDGELGADTRRALRRLQADRGLRICGCVTYETVVALEIVPRVVGRDAVARSSHDRVIVIVPDRRDRRHTGAAVVVGAGSHPGVQVGHDPAVGAGADGRYDGLNRGRHAGGRPSRPSPDDPIGPLPGVGGTIRPGDSGGLRGLPAGDRPPRPTPE